MPGDDPNVGGSHCLLYAFFFFFQKQPKAARKSPWLVEPGTKVAAGQTGTTMTLGPQHRPTPSYDTTGASLMLTSAAGTSWLDRIKIASDHAASATKHKELIETSPGPP